MKKMKRMAALALAVLVLTGCSKQEKEAQPVLDHYKIRKMPVLETAAQPFALYEEEDTLHLLGMNAAQQGALYNYGKDSTWQEQPVQIQVSESELLLDAFSIGGGENIFVYVDEIGKASYYCVKEDGFATPWGMAFAQDSVATMLLPTRMYGTDAGIVCETNQDSVILLDRKTGEVIYRFGNTQGTYLVSTAEMNDSLYLFYETRAERYNLETKKLQDEDKKLNEFIKKYPGSLLLSDDETLYSIGSEGIYSYDTKSRKTVCQKQRLGAEAEALEFLTGVISDNRDIYLAGSKDGVVQVLHYEYSKEGYEAEKQVLKLYTLFERDYEEVIHAFEKKNPDVQIDVEIGIEGDSSLTTEDAIKALNTELTAGNGPDILILDYLPIQSYIDNGLLKDLSSIVNDTEDLMTNVLCTYEKDEAFYAIPVTFSVVGMQGTKDMLENSGTLSDLTEALQQEHKRNPKRMTLSCVMADATIFGLYYDYIYQCFDESGKINADKIRSFYENVKTIYDISSFDKKSQEDVEYADMRLEYVSYHMSGLDFNTLYTIVADAQFASGFIHSPAEFQTLRGVQSEKGIEYQVGIPGQQNYYKPSQIFGVNQNCNNPMAEKFIRFMLYDEEAKEIIGSRKGGIPIHKEYIMKNLTTDIPKNEIAFGENVDDDDMTPIPTKTFSEKEAENLIREMESYVCMPYTEVRFQDAIIRPCVEYINGEKQLEDAVNEAVSKANRILEE